jgi:hypothetical protein
MLIEKKTTDADTRNHRAEAMSQTITIASKNLSKISTMRISLKACLGSPKLNCGSDIWNASVIITTTIGRQSWDEGLIPFTCYSDFKFSLRLSEKTSAMVTFDELGALANRSEVPLAGSSLSTKTCHHVRRTSTHH